MMQIRRRKSAGALISALVALGLLATACSGKTRALHSPTPRASASPAPAATASASPTSTVTPTPSAPAPATVSWKACGAPYQCATVAVPLDWSQPTAGPTVRLALIRLPASGARNQRIGSLFVNPGGPGASAVDFVRGIQDILPPEVLRRFDIVAFDPRGVGSSQPLSCLSGPDLDRYLALDPNPTTPAEIATVVAANQKFAAGCAQDYGPSFLAHINTQDAARDMDYLRQAVGDPKLSYVGYSYGTFLGAQYANLFPTHVRALVLDGAVDPALDGLTFDAQQAVGFDKELQDFFTNCANTHCAFFSGGNPQAAFQALEARITATPLNVGTRQLTQALFLDGVAYGLYSPDTWPTLAGALADAANGNGGPLLAMSDQLTDRAPNGTYDSLTSAGPAVDCVDSSYPPTVAAYQAAAQQAAQQAPVFGAVIVWSSLLCAYWPVPSAIHPAPVHAPGAPPILVVGTTGDPATPYEQAKSLASELSSGVLLTHTGEGHTSLGQGSSCVDSVVTTYLVTLSLPANGSVCGNGNGPPSAPPNATVALRPGGAAAP